MIVCSLNGKTAYPSSSDKIKVTYENQFVKDSGSYTYDISFPMDIVILRTASCMPTTALSSAARVRLRRLPTMW